jgi:hypothetical protein
MRSIKRPRALFNVIVRSETRLSIKNVVIRHSEFPAHNFQNILSCSYLTSLPLSLISLYQINTDRFTHILPSHHFINTLRAGLLNCLNARSRGLSFRHRASCILGQALRYSPENAFYIFNQQIYFII